VVSVTWLSPSINSLGVHRSDATNAWRNIARVTNLRNPVGEFGFGEERREFGP